MHTKEMIMESLRSLTDDPIKNTLNSFFTITDVAEEVGRSTSTVRKWAHMLNDEGLIELTKRCPHCQYYLKIKKWIKKNKTWVKKMKTLLDKLIWHNIQTVFCPECEIFINLHIGEKDKKCPSCNKENLEHAIIKVLKKQERAETLKEIVERIDF